MPGQLKGSNSGPDAVLGVSKALTDLQLSISPLLREEGINKLSLQLGRLKLDCHPLGCQTAHLESHLAVLFHKPSCSTERGGNQGGTVTHLFF